MDFVKLIYNMYELEFVLCNYDIVIDHSNDHFLVKLVVKI